MRSLFARIFTSIISTVLLVLAIVFISMFVSMSQSTKAWNESIVEEYTEQLEKNLEFAESQVDAGKTIIFEDIILGSVEDARVSHLTYIDEAGTEVFNWNRDMRGKAPDEDLIARGYDIPITFQGEDAGVVIVNTFAPNVFSMTKEIIDSMINAIIFSIIAAVILSLTLAYLLSKTISKPISEISKSLNMITKGNSTADIKTDSRITEIEMITEDVKKLQQEILDNERGRAHWLNNIGHDLNTPVTAMKVQIEGLMDHIFTPSDKMFSQMKKELLILENRISSFMDLSHLDSPDLKVNLSKIQSVSFTEGLLLGYDHPIEKKGISLKKDLEEVTFYSDQYILSKAMNAVLDNAFIYSPEKGEVSLSCSVEGDMVCFTVENTGEIPMDVLPHIFKDLVRGDASRTNSGSGLGLTLAKRIVNLLEGTISMENTGSGTVLCRICLPYSE